VGIISYIPVTAGMNRNSFDEDDKLAEWALNHASRYLGELLWTESVGIQRGSSH